MQTLSLLLLVPALIALGADQETPRVQERRSGTIIVQIDGLRNAAGHARVALFNGAAGFPDDESAAYRKATSTIADGRAQVSFDDVPFSDYAVSMYHDANDDGKLNKGLFGIPKEGYGVSNNVVHARRAPSFAEARFGFDRSPSTISIHVHY